MADERDATAHAPHAHGPQAGQRIAADNRRWGSDHVADLLDALGIAALALTPGSSFRGLHDSLVNYRANRGPQPLLFLHEEHAVAAAHGYAKVTGRPMAVGLHSNVGLMHATMAIFNAWCDRVPMLLLGAQGPMDAAARRPWVDWVHTVSDLGALIRGYTKWDNQPASLPAALEAILRACQIAQTAPAGPTYVCLDQTLQEALGDAAAMGDIARFQPPLAGEPPDEAVAAIADALRKAARPLLLVGRVSPDQAAWDRRVQLAEALGADVLTDLKVGARFPTRHPAHREPPGLSATAGGLAMIREADVVVSLDWVDLGGTLRLAHAGRAPRGTIVQCSLDQYSHNGWSMAHQALPPADIAVLADPDRLVAKLLAVIGRDAAKVARPKRVAPPAPSAGAPAAPSTSGADGPMPLQAMAEAAAAILAPEKPCYVRLPIGWPGDVCDFTTALDYLGFDGAGGIGSGPGMAVGAAFALKDSDRLPVAILGDGDFLMSVTALWTAVHLRLPLLVVVANNRSFFNDELHQDRIARERGRPVENRGVAIRIDDPAPDLATLARGQGAVGYGPVASLAALRSTLTVAIAKVRGGATCVVDVHVAREYARGIPAAVLSEKADT